MNPGRRRLLQRVDEPGDRAAARGHRILQPVRRRQPDEAQDRDHHDVVLPGGAFVGPVEGVPEDAAGEAGSALMRSPRRVSRSSR